MLVTELISPILVITWQRPNAELPINKREDENDNDDNTKQFRNASSPTLVTELTPVMLVSDEQFLNVRPCIKKAPDGHENEDKLEQLKNAEPWMLVTELILVIAVNAVQLKNALSPICIKPVAREQSTLVKTGVTEAVEKDELPIDVTENNNVAAVDPEPLYVTLVITVFVFESEYVYVKLLLLTAAVIAAALNPAVVKSPDEYPCKSIPIKDV
jgi:hypothetical protein